MVRSVWRYCFGYSRRLQLRSWLYGYHREPQWIRIIMDAETKRLVSELNPSNLHAVEISGSQWKDAGFASYRSANYPEYDVCASPLPDEPDLIIAEQVFEHLLWPYRGGRNVYESLKPGGYFLVTTPFLLRIHLSPTDCTRWTPQGDAVLSGRVRISDRDDPRRVVGQSACCQIQL